MTAAASQAVPPVDQLVLPRTAYVLLWFPEPTETFIHREVRALARRELPLRVWSLYGPKASELTAAMGACPVPVARLGLPFLPRVPAAYRYWRRRSPERARRCLRLLTRRWGGLERSAENWWAILAGFQLARWVVEQDIQHLHAPWANGPATAAWAASQLTAVPFSFTARARDIYVPDRALADKLQAAAFVRCNTRLNLDRLRAIQPQGNIHCIYNGINSDPVAPAPVMMRAPYKLLALGRLVEKKGFRYLLRACALLRERGIDFRLTLAGAGPQAGSLRRLAARLGIQNQVRLPGHVAYDRVPGLFQQADLFVMPSVVDPSGDRDGIPNVIMEALLHRIPVVATDVSAISELIEHEATGLLVRQRDPVALADALSWMMVRRERALVMAAEGERRVRREFDPEANFGRVLTLLASHTPDPSPA